jgi:hypothetical protein
MLICHCLLWFWIYSPLMMACSCDVEGISFSLPKTVQIIRDISAVNFDKNLIFVAIFCKPLCTLYLLSDLLCYFFDWLFGLFIHVG